MFVLASNQDPGVPFRNFPVTSVSQAFSFNNSELNSQLSPKLFVKTRANPGPLLFFYSEKIIGSLQTLSSEEY